MTISRRRFVRSAAAAGTVALLGARAGAQTPVATPDMAAASLLIDAGELGNTGEEVQRLAVMPRKAFDEARIPGSIPLDWAELELADTSDEAVAAWTETTRELMGARGIRADRPVVAYDEGSLFAARGWWQLAYLGYDLPRVLDGGLPAWAREGEATESGPLQIDPVEAPPVVAAVRRELLVTKAEVLQALEDPDVVLVDARSVREYEQGRIPGARNIPYPDNAAMNVPTYKSPEALREMYEAVGMAGGKRAITYCATGVRGSVAFFSLLLAGFTDVALYVGSWNEWGADPETPKETT